MSNDYSELIARLRGHLFGIEAADALTAQAATITKQARELEALRADAERLRVGHDRYETVRLLSVQQFQDAYVLNRRTGKPFDEIIDDLRPFMRPNDAMQSGKAVTP